MQCEFISLFSSHVKTLVATCDPVTLHGVRTRRNKLMNISKSHENTMFLSLYLNQYLLLVCLLYFIQTESSLENFVSFLL